MYAPSPEEIAVETAKLQAKWSPEERNRRQGLLPKRDPTIKVVSTSYLESQEADHVANWQYLTSQDLKRKVSKKKSHRVVVDIKEESDREPFQASVVEFGA